MALTAAGAMQQLQELLDMSGASPDQVVKRVRSLVAHQEQEYGKVQEPTPEPPPLLFDEELDSTR